MRGSIVSDEHDRDRRATLEGWRVIKSIGLVSGSGGVRVLIIE